MTASFKNCAKLLVRTPADYAWAPPPQPIAPAHCDEAIDTLSERARRIDGILGLYHFGPVRYPGLSDIDVMFILADEFSDYARLRPLLREQQPSAFLDALLHHPFFIRASELPGFFQFAPFFQVRAIWKSEGLPQDNTNENETDLLLFLLDIIGESYPREFIQFLLARSLDERTLIGRIKGLAYCFDLLRRVTGRGEPAFTEYAARVEALRNDYFHLPPPERHARVLALTQQAIPISYRLALVTAEALNELWGLRLAGRMALAAPRAATLYTATPPAEPHYDVVRLRQTDAITLLPLVYGYLIDEYAREQGPVSDRLHRRLLGELRIDTPPLEPVRAAIRRRAALRNRHAAWVDASGLGLAGFLTYGYRMRQNLTGLPWARDAIGRLTEQARDRLLRHRLKALLSDDSAF